VLHINVILKKIIRGLTLTVRVFPVDRVHPLKEEDPEGSSLVVWLFVVSVLRR
jgi:hypothetical protein